MLSVGRVAGGLVDEHQRQVAQRLAESRIVRALVAQRGQPGCGQRMVDDAHVHGPTLTSWNHPARVDRRIAMLVDTDAVRALGAHCSNQADDLSTAAAALKSLPGPDAAAAFGPVGARFLAALADAIAAEARAIAALGEDLASARSRTGVVADAYADADQRGSRLL